MKIKPFYIYFLIQIIAYLILNIIFSYNYAKYNLEENGIILEIKNSLEGKLIYSEEEILSLGKREGCRCNDKIKDQKCSVADIKNNCIKHPLNFQKINSKYICVKKSNNTYKDLMKSNQIFPKDSECPNNFKSCGIIDTLENIFCVPKNETCPITMSDIENSNIFYKNNNIDKMSSTNKIQILSMFIITNNNTPCIDPGENIWLSEPNKIVIQKF